MVLKTKEKPAMASRKLGGERNIWAESLESGTPLARKRCILVSQDEGRPVGAGKGRRRQEKNQQIDETPNCAIGDGI